MSVAGAGLYVHVPFCARVCPYCDFAVRTGNAARKRDYVEHLLAEIELYRELPLEFDTLYLGGGTPSAIPVAEIRRIVDHAAANLRWAPDPQLFLEANPEDVTEAAVRGWADAGVATLSLGIQSLEPEGLAFLGRRHGVDDVRRAVELARDAGFDTVSGDLIYGLPGQGAADWQRVLDRALALELDHWSCYQLTIHRRTRFGLLARRGQLHPLPDDAQGELFRLTHRHLNDAGLQGYEVSQFARHPRHHSRHNRKYWDHTPYLGLGPSAHSYHDRVRWWNRRRSDDWQATLDAGRRPVDGREELDATALVLEALMTGLRTYAGVDLDELHRRWGIDLVAANPGRAEGLAARGLASFDGRRLVPTLDGLAVADSVTAMWDIPAPVSPGG